MRRVELGCDVWNLDATCGIGLRVKCWRFAAKLEALMRHVELGCDVWNRNATCGIGMRRVGLVCDLWNLRAR